MRIVEESLIPANQNHAGQVMPEKKKRRRSAKSYAVSLLIKIGVTVLLFWFLLSFVIGIMVCHDNGCYPMIKDGDLCVTYRLDTIRPGDAIVYRRDGLLHIGRVTAAAGDRVDFAGERVTINGYTASEDTVYPTVKEGTSISLPYQVPDDSVFVLNDYRPDVSDSRTYGGIPLSSVEGKVIFIMRRRGI